MSRNVQANVDALRSLQLWLSHVLPVPWDLQIARSEVERPSGIIRQIGPEPSNGSAYVRDNQADYEVFLYPLGIEGEPVQSELEARRLVADLKKAMTQGVIVTVPAYQSYCLRIPVFDYDDVPWNEDLPPAAASYDFFPVSNFTVEARVDPDDDTLFTVVMDLRMSWRTDGDISRTKGTILQDVRVGYTGN